MIGAYFISTNLKLDLKDSKDRKVFVNHMAGWIVKVTKNLFALAGEVIKQDWSPVKNDTKTTN